MTAKFYQSATGGLVQALGLFTFVGPYEGNEDSLPLAKRDNLTLCAAEASSEVYCTMAGDPPQEGDLLVVCRDTDGKVTAHLEESFMSGHRAMGDDLRSLASSPVPAETVGAKPPASEAAAPTDFAPFAKKADDGSDNYYVVLAAPKSEGKGSNKK